MESFHERGWCFFLHFASNRIHLLFASWLLMERDLERAVFV